MKQNLCDIYSRWLLNIIQEQEGLHSDEALRLNDCGWNPDNYSNDQMLQHYYKMEYILKKLRYMFYEKYVGTLLDEKAMKNIFDFLKENHIDSYFITKYNKKLKLHYPEL